MLLPSNLVKWDEYAKIRPYCDPVFKSKKKMLELLVRMAPARMLRRVPKVIEPVFFFCVVKKVLDDGTVILRLVWDLRRSNLRWRKPMRAAMGSPIAFSFLELSGETVGGRPVWGFDGDVPDLYYCCGIHPDLSPYFGIPDISWDELREALVEAGIDPSCVEGEGDEIGMAVLGMGWSWACVLAECELEDTFDSEEIPMAVPAGRVSDVLPTPTFEVGLSFLFWTFIDATLDPGACA